MKIRKNKKFFFKKENLNLEKIILALNLSIAQINLSMKDGEYSIDTLIDGFNTFKDMEGIKNNSEYQDKINNSIMAFQFYDKLSQRLAHVEKGLELLTQIMTENKISDHKEWNKFQANVEKFTSMAEEYKLYEMIFIEKKGVKESIELLKNNIKQEEKKDIEDDIIFF